MIDRVNVIRHDFKGNQGTSDLFDSGGYGLFRGRHHTFPVRYRVPVLRAPNEVVRQDELCMAGRFIGCERLPCRICMYNSIC